MFKMLTYEFPRHWESIEIYPLNDLHIGEKETDVELFKRFIKMILEKENRYLVLVGDLMNNALKSSVSNVYGDSMSPSEQKKFLIRELKPVKDRILSITPGNHEGRSKKDSDCDVAEDIAVALGLEDRYREKGAFIKISVGERQDKQRQNTYIIHALHGFGGGKGSGSSVNNLENYGVVYEGVDIYIMGHVHRRVGNRGSKIVVDPRNNVITQRDVLYYISSAWQNYGGYGMKMMLRPGVKGASPIILDGKRKDFAVII